MIVCICLRVSDRDIAHAASRGCASFEQLQRHLCVATRCNRCREHALAVFQLHTAASAVAGPCQSGGAVHGDGDEGANG